MLLTRARILSLVCLCALPAAAQAQTPDDTLEVPVGALKVLGYAGRDEPALCDAASDPGACIRRRGATRFRSRCDFERLLDGLDHLERELKRSGTRGIVLGMARAPQTERLRDTLDALGLRLREQRRVYTVEMRRARLAPDCARCSSTPASTPPTSRSASTRARPFTLRRRRSSCRFHCRSKDGLPTFLPAESLQRRAVQRDHPQSRRVAAVLRRPDDDAGHACVPGEDA